MAEPFRLVGVAFQAQARDEGFVAADDDHHEQVGDHDHVDQAQHDEHDFLLAGRTGVWGDQVPQLLQEEQIVYALGDDQAQVRAVSCSQRELKIRRGQRAEAGFLDGMHGRFASHGCVGEFGRAKFYRPGCAVRILRRGCSPGASRGAPVPGEFPVNDLFIRYIISLFLGK